MCYGTHVWKETINLMWMALLIRGRFDLANYGGVDTRYIIGIFFDPLEIHDSD